MPADNAVAVMCTRVRAICRYRYIMCRLCNIYGQMRKLNSSARSVFLYAEAFRRYDAGGDVFSSLTNFGTIDTSWK